MKRQTAKKEQTKQETNVVPFFGAGTDVANVEAMQQAMAQVGSLSRNVGGGLFLRFTKMGEWLFGQDQDEIEAGEMFAVNPLSFKNGWIGWKGGQVFGEHMCPVTQGMPCTEDQLDPIPNPGQNDGWSAQLGIELRSMDPDEPLELRFNTTSRGGKQTISGLAEAISQRMASSPESCVPLVVLEADSYKHKQYGTINVPVIRPVGWADLQGNVVEGPESPDSA